MSKRSWSCRKITSACAAAAMGLALNGCGSGDSGTSSSTANAGDGARPNSIAVIRRLEQKGAIPVLDRSDDLRGPDTDNNGIRDDIDAYIDKQRYTEKEKKAVQQFAKAMQLAILADPSDPDAYFDETRRISYRGALAIQCLSIIKSPTRDMLDSIEIYEKLTANTRARARAYLAYNHALSGHAMNLPSGDTCEQ